MCMLIVICKLIPKHTPTPEFTVTSVKRVLTMHILHSAVTWHHVQCAPEHTWQDTESSPFSDVVEQPRPLCMGGAARACLRGGRGPGLSAWGAWPRLVCVGGAARACACGRLSPRSSYMEDHVKNKNRLEKEWEALCAYQAEPNSSLVAQREENMPKNRSLAVLTCTRLALSRKALMGLSPL
ncbi:hypothetical protein P7K49_026063 [Saguinus oedipus]|uniref:Uncharacterized protein n=1 Tax=Saguinus oedipus TaxID=9490 RepID=A0ABQ9UJR5_SAGOE|nr:hypothetical protein P7K49_026063 [Saguinus oedipus]